MSKSGKQPSAAVADPHHHGRACRHRAGDRVAAFEALGGQIGGHPLKLVGDAGIFAAS